MEFLEEILRTLAGFSAVVSGVMMGSIRDPVQVMLLVLIISIGLSRARLWVILLASLCGSIFLAIGAYPRYIQAGVNPWAVLPLSLSARFVGFSFVGVVFRVVSRSFERAKRT